MEVRGLTCQQECNGERTLCKPFDVQQLSLTVCISLHFRNTPAAGWFLDWSNNLTSPTSECAQCPMGTYSVGGGTLYSGRTKLWNHMPSEFR
jgi:hypothetical protein